MPSASVISLSLASWAHLPRKLALFSVYLGFARVMWYCLRPVSVFLGLFTHCFILSPIIECTLSHLLQVFVLGFEMAQFRPHRSTGPTLNFSERMQQSGSKHSHKWVEGWQGAAIIQTGHLPYQNKYHANRKKDANKLRITRVCRELRLRWKPYACHGNGGYSPNVLLSLRPAEWATLSWVPLC